LALSSLSFFGGLGRVATTVALVVILFEGGLGTSLREMTTSLGASLKLTIGGFFGSMVIGSTLVWFCSSWIGPFDWSFMESLLFGSIIAGTSSAVVIPMLKYLGLGSKISSASRCARRSFWESVAV